MTNPNISTLRPGLLVSLSIRITGNVSYSVRDLEKRHKEEDGTERARWETERIVENAAELRRAEKVRSEARKLISKVCARSSFGLLCPSSWEKELHANIAEARRLAAEFNGKARCTEMQVYAIVGRVAQDDVEAARAINAEVRTLMREMTEGIKGLNVKRVRDAASRARAVGSMLSEDASAKLKVAIEAARAGARKLVAAGEESARAIDKEAIKAITQARTAFLDLDAGDVLSEAKPAPKPRSREVEVPEEPAAAKKPARKGAAKKKEA